MGTHLAFSDQGPQGISYAVARAIAERPWAQPRVDDRIHHVHQGALHHPIPHSWDVQFAVVVGAGLTLGKEDSRQGSRPIAASDQIGTDCSQPIVEPLGESINRRRRQPVLSVVEVHDLPRIMQIPYIRRVPQQSACSFQELTSPRLASPLATMRLAG